MAETFLNDTTWTLAAGMAASDTTAAVAVVAGSLDAAPTAAGPNTLSMRVRIDNEILIVTGTSGTNWSVTRGAEGTTAATHAQGATIGQILTKGALATLAGSGSSGGSTALEGPYSARPAAGTQGRTYRPTDSVLGYFDNGASWDAFGPTFPLVQPPVQSAWTVTNQYNATIAFNQGLPSIFTASTANSGGNNLTLLTVPVPNTSGFTVQAMILPAWQPCVQQNVQVGLCFVDTNGVISTICYDNGGQYQRVSGLAWTNPTTYSGNNWNTFGNQGGSLASARFLGLRFATNSLFPMVSGDGRLWCAPFNSYGSVTSSTVPASIGFFINAGAGSAVPIGGTLVHWNVTTP